MNTIILNGWRVGMQKVSLTKLQVSRLGKSLKDAKENVDSLLDYNVVRIEIEDIDIANEFIRMAQEIGVDCYLEIG